MKIVAAGACTTPVTQPTDLVLSPASTSIAGLFSSCSDADTYLVLQSTDETLTDNPVDAVEYSSGDSIGNAVVTAYGTSTSFTASGLSGSTKYYYTVFAAGAYGTEGPKYNVVDPLTGSASTLPEAPTAITVDEVSENGVSISITGNSAGNDVVVLYTTFRQNVRTGDFGIYGTIPASASVGDTIELGDDYAGSDVITPTHGGVVAYVGAPASDILLEGLEKGTLYYLVAYSRDADGNLSTGCIYSGVSTIIEAPYTSVMDSWPHYVLPYGWQYSESGDNVGTWSVTWTSSTTKCDNLYSQIKPGDATNGYTSWIVPQPINVNDRHISVAFNYGVTCQSLRSSSSQYYYNEWNEGDTLALQVSTDGGATWTTLTQYDSTNNPQLADDEEGTLVPAVIAADLNDYRGETVLARLFWRTYSYMTYGTKLTLYSLAVEQLEYPDVPDVTVSDVTYNSAKVSWLSTQASYQVAYKLSDAEEYGDTITVDTLFCTLTDLETLATYDVVVRGIIETDGDTTYSEWSDVVSFTTLDWPDVAAPTGLSADTDAFLADGIVTLTWESTDDMEYYLLAYRESSSTVWTEVDSIAETSYNLASLEVNTRYLWRIKAYCTHERVTDWSSQATFTTPDWPAVDAPTGLVSDLDAWEESQTAVLTWETTDEMLSFVLAYKAANADDWTTVEGIEQPSYTLEGLEAETQYTWKVYALCTHDRTTEWSDEAVFTTPIVSGIASIVGNGITVSSEGGNVTIGGARGASVAVYNVAGTRQYATASASDSETVSLPAGIYIISINNKAMKVSVKY